ncbi:MAG: general stress protein 26 [Verrucomicrobiales bacterium]|jgi:general stress protein 26
MTDIDLADVKNFASGLSPWAHLASVGTDNRPDVVPVHPCWEAETCWVMTFNNSVKARNIEVNPNVAMHWQVDESGNGVELWGSVNTFDDVETKRRLWDDVFDYDLNAFAPGGPEDSPGVSFLAVRPERAIIVHAYGAGGIDRWRKAD